MSDINRIIAKEIAKTDDVKPKIIPGNVIRNESPNMEWVKWLSYEPEFEKKRI